MKATKLLQRAFFGMVLLLSGWAHADVALTEELVDRWISSQQAITAWGEQHADRLDDLAHEGIPNSVAEFVQPLRSSGLYDEAEDILEKYGFDSPEDWAGVTLRIMHAMGAVQMQGQAMDYDMQAQLEQMQNDPNIPAEQKEMMLKMMKEGMQMMEKAKNAPQADVDAIRPQLDKIMQFFDSQGGE